MKLGVLKIVEIANSHHVMDFLTFGCNIFVLLGDETSWPKTVKT
jgi:hypothetical protein